VPAFFTHRRHPWYSFLSETESTLKRMKNPNDPIWNRTRDVSACSAVPQPTAAPRAQKEHEVWNLGMFAVLCSENICC